MAPQTLEGGGFQPHLLELVSCISLVNAPPGTVSPHTGSFFPVKGFVYYEFAYSSFYRHKEEGYRSLEMPCNPWGSIESPRVPKAWHPQKLLQYTWG